MIGRPGREQVIGILLSHNAFSKTASHFHILDLTFESIPPFSTEGGFSRRAPDDDDRIVAAFPLNFSRRIRYQSVQCSDFFLVH
jgi:hypothetical protein